MQTMGLPAVAENNIILVDEVTLGVVEACSGLGMIITLFALTTTAVLTRRRVPWQMPVILLSFSHRSAGQRHSDFFDRHPV